MVGIYHQKDEKSSLFVYVLIYLLPMPISQSSIIILQLMNHNIHSLPVMQLGVAVGLEPIPAVIERETGYTLDTSPVYRKGNTEIQTTTHSRLVLHNQQSS